MEQNNGLFPRRLIASNGLVDDRKKLRTRGCRGVLDRAEGNVTNLKIKGPCGCAEESLGGICKGDVEFAEPVGWAERWDFSSRALTANAQFRAESTSVTLGPAMRPIAAFSRG